MFCGAPLDGGVEGAMRDDWLLLLFPPWLMVGVGGSGRSAMVCVKESGAEVREGRKGRSKKKEEKKEVFSFIDVRQS